MAVPFRVCSGLCACALLVACSSDTPGGERDAALAGSAGVSAPSPVDAGLGDAADATLDAGAPDAALVDAAVDAEVDAALPPPLPSVTFTPAAGTFTGASIAVELAAVPGDGDLYYTLDGSLPSVTSAPYTAPITLSTTTLLRVALYDASGALVRLQSASYVQLGADVTTFDSNLPLVVVHMLSGTAPSPLVETTVPAVVQVHDRDAASGRATLLDPAALDARVAIKVRGRSTRFQPKKSYTFELRDDLDGDDEDAQVLDFPPQSDFVLYAPYEFDRAMVRNAFWYALSRELGRYAPRTRFVEVFLAESGQAVDQSKYLGVYVLTETIKRDSARVSVQKLSASDTTEPAITGGYILRIDDPEPNELTFSITGMPDAFVLRYPSETAINAQQKAYLEGYLDAAGRAFAASDRVDPTTGKTLQELVDLDALIDHHILNVLAKNPDAFRLSAYWSKNRGGALVAGPLWDCDRCMGSYDQRDKDPVGWDPLWDSTKPFAYGWYQSFFSDPVLAERYWKRWEALLAGALDAQAFDATIDAMAAELTEASARNAARWPEMPYQDGMYQSEIDHLKSWLDQRLTWIAANLRNPP